MKLSKSFPFTLFLVFLATYVVHEFAHWLVGAYFGFEMKPSLNAIRLLSPAEPWQKALMDGAGPLVTILQGCVAFAIVLRRHSHLAFAFLYTAAFMRAVAGLISLFNPNDEARLSVFFGLPMWVLPTLVAAFLIGLLVKASRHLKLGWKDQLLCYVSASIISAIVVGFDRFVMN